MTASDPESPDGPSTAIESDVMLRPPTDVLSWEDNSAFWVKIIQDKMDRFRTELTDPAVLAEVGDPVGRLILDAGCGEGYLSRAIAGQGGVVVGVDGSKSLVAAARRTSTKQDGIRFEQGDITQLDLLGLAGKFDTVVANHVINDLPDPVPAIKQFAKVLRPNGTLIILMLHPCFYTTRQERNSSVTYQIDGIAASYFSHRHIRDHFDVAGLRSPAPTSRYLRPFGEYTKMLTDAGFVITAIAEPRPNAAQLRDPWWKEHFPVPLFLLIAARLQQK
jgi:SAM-dependent methyltransferase